LRMMLDHFPGTLQARNLDPDADDRLHERCNVIDRCIRYSPGFGIGTLRMGRQILDMMAQPRCIVDDGDRAMGVDSDLVPGGDDFAGGLLGRQPAGMHIGLGTLEDGQSL
jgi:hypothetical protein